MCLIGVGWLVKSEAEMCAVVVVVMPLACTASSSSSSTVTGVVELPPTSLYCSGQRATQSSTLALALALFSTGTQNPHTSTTLHSTILR